MQPDEEKSRFLSACEQALHLDGDRESLMSHAKANATGFLWPYPSMASYDSETE